MTAPMTAPTRSCPPAGAKAEGLMPGAKLNFILSHRNKTSVPLRPPCDRSVAFIGIGKTGSLFMQSALELFAHEQTLPAARPQARPCTVGARMGWHHASALLWRRAFGTDYDNAYTFALVRDPWARLVSHWAFHIASRNPLDGGHLTQEQRGAAKADEAHSIRHFRSWVHHAWRTHPPNATDAWRFTTGDAHGNEQSRGFNASQLSWLVDEHGKMLVDDVIRLEDLERRWPELQARVCGLRGVSYRETKDHPLIREMDHPSRHGPVGEYFDEETSRIVAEYMAPDIRRFGYSAPKLNQSGR